MDILNGASLLLVVAGFPMLLLFVLVALAALEAWVLQPDERAAAVREMLDRAMEAEEVEAAVARLLADVAEPRYERADTRSHVRM